MGRVGSEWTSWTAAEACRGRGERDEEDDKEGEGRREESGGGSFDWSTARAGRDSQSLSRTTGGKAQGKAWDEGEGRGSCALSPLLPLAPLLSSSALGLLHLVAARPLSCPSEPSLSLPSPPTRSLPPLSLFLCCPRPSPSQREKPVERPHPRRLAISTSKTRPPLPRSCRASPPSLCYPASSPSSYVRRSAARGRTPTLHLTEPVLLSSPFPDDVRRALLTVFVGSSSATTWQSTEALREWILTHPDVDWENQRTRTRGPQKSACFFPRQTPPFRVATDSIADLTEDALPLCALPYRTNFVVQHVPHFFRRSDIAPSPSPSSPSLSGGELTY